jgi:pimeloyl-ACP methyl ester carboxylesterase
MRKVSTPLLTTLLFFALPGCGRERGHQVRSADDVTISYHVQGQGKPALVFVHGWCCDKSYWKSQVPHFAKQHKVVTVDLAGHGESGLGREDWSMEAFGKDVAAVVEKLDLDQVILIGHSMGGPVVLAAAQQMPKRTMGVVGVDTYLNVDREYTQEQIDEYLGRLRTDFADTTSKLVRRLFAPDADPDLVEWVVADMCSGPPHVGIGAVQGYLKFDRKEALREIRVPIYSINSDMRPTDIRPFPNDGGPRDI